MDVENNLMPDDAQAKAFGDPGPDGPITMLNLLKFKERAEYDHGRDVGLSGAEAYAIYGKEIAHLVKGVGGALLYSGRVNHLAIGAVEDMWDHVLLVRYPSRGALAKMTRSEEYQNAAKHRIAGLAGQLLIETV